MQYGRWTVTGEPTAGLHSKVRCRCDCGTERMVLVFSLRSGKSQSCGCLKREQVGTLASRTRWTNSHGLSRHPLYQLWKRINRRCYDPEATQYRWYGARGIGVHEDWRHDAEAFITYVEQNLGPRPDGKSLDRIDNDGDYAPGNVRWATATEQAHNRRPR